MFQEDKDAVVTKRHLIDLMAKVVSIRFKCSKRLGFITVNYNDNLNSFGYSGEDGDIQFDFFFTYKE